jgi:hypothetical protein
MCLGGSQCTRVCSSNTDCPAGWVCARDPKSGLEYCIEQKALLCAPCKGDGDCLGTDENFCAKLPGGSAACASGCNPKLINSCPPGYKCAPAASVSTTAAHDACVPEALSCPAKEVVPSAPPAGTVRIPSTLKTAAGRD